MKGLEKILMAKDIAELLVFRAVEGRYVIVEDRRELTMLIGFQSLDDTQLFSYFSGNEEYVGNGKLPSKGSRIVVSGGVIIPRKAPSELIRFNLCSFEMNNGNYKKEEILKKVFVQSNYT